MNSTPRWVQARILVYTTSEGLRIDATGGPIDLARDGSERITENIDAGQRALCTVVPADSAHGRYRVPNAKTPFVAVYADRDDKLTGKEISSLKELQAIVLSVIF